MRGGFQQLVNSPTQYSDIDVAGTKAERDRIHALMRQQPVHETEARLQFRNRYLTTGV